MHHIPKGILVYLNSLHGDFVYDDMKAVVENADVDAALVPNWRDVFKHNFWGVILF